MILTVYHSIGKAFTKRVHANPAKDSLYELYLHSTPRRCQTTLSSTNSLVRSTRRPARNHTAEISFHSFLCSSGQKDNNICSEKCNLLLKIHINGFYIQHTVTVICFTFIQQNQLDYVMCHEFY